MSVIDIDGASPLVTPRLEAVFSIGCMYSAQTMHCTAGPLCVHCTVHGIVMPSLRALTSPQEFLLKTRNIASLVSHFVIAR